MCRKIPLFWKDEIISDLSFVIEKNCKMFDSNGKAKPS